MTIKHQVMVKGKKYSITTRTGDIRTGIYKGIVGNYAKFTKSFNPDCFYIATGSIDIISEVR